MKHKVLAVLGIVALLAGMLVAVVSADAPTDTTALRNAVTEENVWKHLKALQKIANRITSGLILAAMIVGAALMLRVETEFTILGYPGIAILLFLVAAAFGARMVIANFLQDRRTRTRRRG